MINYEQVDGRLMLYFEIEDLAVIELGFDYDAIPSPEKIEAFNNRIMELGTPGFEVENGYVYNPISVEDYHIQKAENDADEVEL